MNSKILNYSKKLIAILVIVLLCSSSTVQAFSFGTQNTGTTSGGIRSLINRFLNLNSYDTGDLYKDLGQMKNSGNIDLSKISELINKLPNNGDKSILEYIMSMFTSDGISKIDLSSLVDKLMGALQSLLGISGGSELPVEATSINMNAKTAAQFAGEDYNVKLHASVYMHVDENGNKDSDKWVLLIHANSLDGESIAKTVGPFYYEKGYNILAPDLRGAGDSEGECGLGFLESLDAYDWLNKLNDEYAVSQVFVHGISLGGATTNFLSGIDKFISNGPTKMDATIKPISELKVIGLVEDCGYTDMTQFSSKNSLLKSNIGLTEDNFDYYSKATNSLQYCNLPMLIIHGTSDIIVKVENADTVKNTVKGETEEWLVDGQNHAFIIMGMKTDEYKEHVQAFIDKYENTSYIPPVYTETTPKDDVVEETTPEETQSFFEKIINALKSLRK